MKHWKSRLLVCLLTFPIQANIIIDFKACIVRFQQTNNVWWYIQKFV